MVPESGGNVTFEEGDLGMWILAHARRLSRSTLNAHDRILFASFFDRAPHACDWGLISTDQVAGLDSAADGPALSRTIPHLGVTERPLVSI